MQFKLKFQLCPRFTCTLIYITYISSDVFESELVVARLHVFKFHLRSRRRFVSIIQLSWGMYFLSVQIQQLVIIFQLPSIHNNAEVSIFLMKWDIPANFVVACSGFEWSCWNLNLSIFLWLDINSTIYLPSIRVWKKTPGLLCDLTNTLCFSLKKR